MKRARHWPVGLISPVAHSAVLESQKTRLALRRFVLVLILLVFLVLLWRLFLLLFSVFRGRSAVCGGRWAFCRLFRRTIIWLRRHRSFCGACRRLFRRTVRGRRVVRLRRRTICRLRGIRRTIITIRGRRGRWSLCWTFCRTILQAARSASPPDDSPVAEHSAALPRGPQDDSQAAERLAQLRAGSRISVCRLARPIGKVRTRRVRRGTRSLSTDTAGCFGGGATLPPPAAEPLARVVFDEPAWATRSAAVVLMASCRRSKLGGGGGGAVLGYHSARLQGCGRPPHSSLPGTQHRLPRGHDGRRAHFYLSAGDLPLIHPDCVARNGLRGSKRSRLVATTARNTLVHIRHIRHARIVDHRRAVIIVHNGGVHPRIGNVHALHVSFAHVVRRQ